MIINMISYITNKNVITEIIKPKQEPIINKPIYGNNALTKPNNIASKHDIPTTNMDLLFSVSI